MSYVTSIILTTWLTDAGGVAQLNAYIAEKHDDRGDGLILVSQHARGGKAMQCRVYVAAVNWLMKDDFIELFRSIRWHRPSCAQLMLLNEHDDVFTTYTTIKRGDVCPTCGTALYDDQTT